MTNIAIMFILTAQDSFVDRIYSLSTQSKEEPL